MISSDPPRSDPISPTPQHSKPPNLGAHALPHIPQVLAPSAQANADIGPGLELQAAAEGLADLVVAELAETPVDGQGRAGAGAGGDVEGQVVQDAAQLDAVVARRRVQPRDGERRRQRRQQRQGGRRREQVHSGVVNEARRVVGGGGRVGVVGVFGRVQVRDRHRDWDGAEGGAEAGLVGDGSGVGAEREACIVALF